MDTQFQQEEDIDNTVDNYSVTINGFIFCTRHGLELCDKCPTDNRGANNMIVEDSLHDRLTEEEFSTKWKGDDREPLSVVHQWTRVNGKPGCMKHKQVGCNECFNWGEKLYRDVHGGRAPRQSRRKDKQSQAEQEDVMH